MVVAAKERDAAVHKCCCCSDGKWCCSTQMVYYPFKVKVYQHLHPQNISTKFVDLKTKKRKKSICVNDLVEHLWTVH